MINKSKVILKLALLFIVISCAHQPKSDFNQDHMILATLWIQNSPEYKALCYQAFNSARKYLDYDLRYNRTKRKRAVIVDVDETVMDNSPYSSSSILKNRSYSSDTWGKWVDRASAKAVPGAVSFLKYAASKGVEIFYITNRKVRGYEATYNNLIELGFPVKRENLMLRTSTSSKKARRDKVMKEHHVIILAGDAMGDFHEIFEGKNIEENFQTVHKSKDEFGGHYIVLPNPMYGAWLEAIYDFNHKKTSEEKFEDRLNHLYPIKER